MFVYNFKYVDDYYLSITQSKMDLKYQKLP